MTGLAKMRKKNGCGLYKYLQQIRLPTNEKKIQLILIHKYFFKCFFTSFQPQLNSCYALHCIVLILPCLGCVDTREKIVIIQQTTHVQSGWSQSCHVILLYPKDQQCTTPKKTIVLSVFWFLFHFRCVYNNFMFVQLFSSRLSLTHIPMSS